MAHRLPKQPATLLLKKMFSGGSPATIKAVQVRRRSARRTCRLYQEKKVRIKREADGKTQTGGCASLSFAPLLAPPSEHGELNASAPGATGVAA